MIDHDHFHLLHRAAPSERLIVIGDIHGKIDLLRALLDQVRALPRLADTKTTLVFLGDLIDRGPKSAACISLAMDAQRTTGVDESVFLRGNHEEMLLTGLTDHDPRKSEVALCAWLQNGGAALVEELGCGFEPENIRHALGPDRMRWLENLRVSYRSGQILCVHAGVHPAYDVDAFLADRPLPLLNRTFREDLSPTWIREPFLDHQPGPGGHGGFFVLHGHTPGDARRVPPAESVQRSRLNLDGGSYSTGRARMAVVTNACVDLFVAT